MHVWTFYKTKDISPSGKKCFNSGNCWFLVGRLGGEGVTGWLKKAFYVLMLCWSSIKGNFKVNTFTVAWYMSVCYGGVKPSAQSTRKQKGLKYKSVPCFSSSPSVTE